MKKIVVPVSNGKLCAEFERCSEFIIFSVVQKKKCEKRLVYTNLQPGLYPQWLAQKGVSDLIVDRIEFKTIQKLNQYKINVFVGVKKTNPNILLQEYLDNALETKNVSVK